MLSVVITGPTGAEAREQIESTRAFSGCYELRLDYFVSLDFAMIQSLMQGPQPFILTLRPTYKYQEKERMLLLERLADLNPAFLDLESSLPKSFIEKMSRRVKIILSEHHYDQTPTNLNPTDPNSLATYRKIVTHAHSSLDTWRMLQFLRTQKNCIGMCMGEKGIFSRILGPIYGGHMTYACVDQHSQTAPGQIDAAELIHRYSFNQISPSTRVFGLIGDPISNSISDRTHNPVFTQLKIDAVYVKMHFLPSELAHFIPHISELGISGISVTMPLKEHVIPFLDIIEEEAQSIGSVNTIVIREGKTIGFNTDGKGALDAIEEKISISGKTLLVLGAGGAARAIIYEAKKRGAHVILLNRTHEKAQQLATHFQVEACTHVPHHDILINCTSLPMPIDSSNIIPYSVVMDITTGVNMTELLRHAQRKNCTIINGVEMFINQAVQQFNLWFGGEVDPKEVRRIIRENTPLDPN